MRIELALTKEGPPHLKVSTTAEPKESAGQASVDERRSYDAVTRTPKRATGLREVPTRLDFSESEPGRSVGACFLATAQAAASATAIIVPMPGSPEKVQAELSYEQLAGAVQKLATKLNPRKAPLALILERSVEMIIAILASTMLSAPSVPIEPQHPEMRVLTILNESGAGILLTMERLHEKVPLGYRGDIWMMDKIHYEAASQPLSCSSVSSDVLYIFFTSGTTGQPKGVIRCDGHP